MRKLYFASLLCILETFFFCMAAHKLQNTSSIKLQVMKTFKHFDAISTIYFSIALDKGNITTAGEIHTITHAVSLCMT